MAVLGFSRGGCANSQKYYYFSIFLPKTARKWKNLDPQRGASLAAPLDPTMGTPSSDHSHKIWTRLCPVGAADLHCIILGARSPLDQNLFIFIQFLRKFGGIIGWGPPPWKVPDTPSNFFYNVAPQQNINTLGLNWNCFKRDFLPPKGDVRDICHVGRWCDREMTVQKLRWVWFYFFQNKAEIFGYIVTVWSGIANLHITNPHKKFSLCRKKLPQILQSEAQNVDSYVFSQQSNMPYLPDLNVN